ncbi:gliding motility-associated C-terminal domain-containing protein [Paenimyroides tangerinum]|uniref:gliding motility-associated C-terminal domain-containing protein n=1 Tax=Paenimyroides tangerinum TaxID=2488728 RepID=UPI0021D2FB65|nr:gliding motility-associated C-terminal domain-containing protein [Paenimyroides tangerinum]
MQKGISPNGDGLNEYFDLVSFGGVDLKIFNRYGSVVYEKSNYKNEWNGQSKTGKQLPSGTYFYQIQTNIGEQFTGYIQLTY